MTDNTIIKGLQNLSINLNNEMRFQEAEYVDQAIARLLSLPSQISRLAHPSEDWDRTIEAIWGIPRHDEATMERARQQMRQTLNDWGNWLVETGRATITFPDQKDPDNGLQS